MCSVPWVPEEVLEGFCLFSWRSLDGEQEAKARMVRLSLSSPLILSVLFVSVFTHKFTKCTKVTLYRLNRLIKVMPSGIGERS